MVTLSDVAKQANVSKMTVSRVINHPEQVTAELRQLVEAAMATLDYRPNAAAKALANNRTNVIKLVILEDIDTTEPYYMSLLFGIAKGLDKCGYALQLVTERERLGKGNAADGFIVTGARAADLPLIDALSYWTQHPELTNCMIASVDGTKVESVVNMAVNMYKTKGQLPATIYVGSDNDPAGHQLYDKLQDSILANTEAEVTTFKPLFPQDNAITQATYQDLKQAANQAGIDWRELAAAVKATTNLSTNFQQSFPLPQAIAKSSVLIDPNPEKTNFNSDEALLTAAKFIKANRTSEQQPDWDTITKKLNPGIEDHDREHLAAKSSYYNTRYQADNGILPVTKIAKDWNELAKLAQHPAAMDQQLEKTYRRQDGKTAKLIVNGQDQFSLVDRKQPDKVVGYFEANDPQQCAYLIKQYGYNAVDKEDEQKYQQTQPVKPQQHKKQRAAGLEKSM